MVEAEAKISTNQKTAHSVASACFISHAVDRVLSGCDDVLAAMTRFAATSRTTGPAGDISCYIL